MTEKLIGMTEPGQPPPPFGPESVIDPHAPPKEETETPSHRGAGDARGVAAASVELHTGERT